MARPINGKYKLSETFDAPLDYVFAWCTDFREDDNKMIGSKTARKILEKSPERVIWRVSYKDGKKVVEGVRAVWLRPPNAWYLDTCGDGREMGEYKLKSLGKSKTRLDMKFVVTYPSKDEVEDKEEWEDDGKKHWKIYRKALEADFKAGRPAASPASSPQGRQGGKRPRLGPSPARQPSAAPTEATVAAVPAVSGQ